MSFQGVMQNILPPANGYSAGVTTDGGTRQDFWAPRERKNGPDIHSGTDINYAGVGQGGINMTHPSVGSPISGTVESVDPKWGKVRIRDDYGNVHEIMHLDSTSVAAGSSVSAGQEIGKMGGRGDKNGDGIFGPNEFAQHVHYKIEDYFGNPIDPELYHDKGGTGDTTGCLNPPEDIFGGIPILEQSVLDFETAESTSPAPVRLTGSPIILDLDGDGIETIGVNAGAYFDHGGDGFAEQTGWVGADDGLLVWDRNSDGRINDGEELFGSETLLSDGTKAANGYAALAELGCRKWGHSAFLEPLTANDEEKSRMSPFLLSETNPGDRSALLDQILFKWTGVDAVDPTSRGSFFDARKLVVMEKFYGRNAYDAKCNVYASSTALA